jgi:hypothetical protein
MLYNSTWQHSCTIMLPNLPKSKDGDTRVSCLSYLLVVSIFILIMNWANYYVMEFEMTTGLKVVSEIMQISYTAIYYSSDDIVILSNIIGYLLKFICQRSHCDSNVCLHTQIYFWKIWFRSISQLFVNSIQVICYFDESITRVIQVYQ